MLDEISLKLLAQTHFSDTEARVYLAVMQLGQAKVSAIADLAGLKRPSAYSILDGLVAQGYINESPAGKIKHYSAVDPRALAAELENSARDFREMLPYLRSMQRKAGKPHVTYYNGAEGARHAYSLIKRPHEVRYALSINKITKHLPDEVERWKKLYIKGRARSGGQHLLTDSSADRAYGRTIKNTGQIVRYLKKGQELAMDLALFDNTVVLTAFDEDIHVTVIESSSLYRSLITLYDLAWSAAKS